VCRQQYRGRLWRAGLGSPKVFGDPSRHRICVEAAANTRVPAVLQVVTRAMPHEMLGEDVAAAVVLREGSAASERELRAFLLERPRGVQRRGEGFFFATKFQKG
jgi:acyl-CoA synthetase (AMP-forming)/AMP-acid ligase II